MSSFKTRDDALEYVNEVLKENEYDFTKKVLELIPESSKMSYGDSELIQAANYHRQVLTSEKYVNNLRALRGGGLFKTTRDCYLGKKGTYFTFIPLVSDGEEVNNGLVIHLISGVTLELAIERFLNLLESASIEYLIGPGYTSFEKTVNKDKLKSDSSAYKSDLKYLKQLFSEHGVTTPEDFAIEAGLLYMSLPEEAVNEFPKTRQGEVLAVAKYCKANEVKVKELLSSSITSRQDTQESSDSYDLHDGSVVLATRNTKGLNTGHLYLVMVDEETGDCMLIPLVGEDEILKKSAAVLLILSTTALTAITLSSMLTVNKAYKLTSGTLAVTAEKSLFATEEFLKHTAKATRVQGKLIKKVFKSDSLKVFSVSTITLVAARSFVSATAKIDHDRIIPIVKISAQEIVELVEEDAIGYSKVLVGKLKYL